jgi:hypothetical protein
VWDVLSDEYFLKITNEYDSAILMFTKDKITTFLGKMTRMILNEGLFGDYIYLVGRDEGFRFDYRDEYVLLAYYDNLGGRGKGVIVQSKDFDQFVDWLNKIRSQLNELPPTPPLE